MEEFDEFCYFKKDLIGHGAFAIVYKGRHKVTNAQVAIKAISKKNINKARNLLGKEIRILKELSWLKHENLVTLVKCIEQSSYVYLVLEYCNGGDLGDYLLAKEKMSEKAIQHFFAQIARALEAINLKGIVHRDLKPQNILLCNPHEMTDVKIIEPTDLVVKLADFGFARFLTGDGMAGTLCGSPMYMAPEVIMSLPYCAKADLWSVGTIMYQCLVGKAPFIAQTPQALKHYYEKNKDLRPNLPAKCSPELADLLIRLLKRNARDRMEFSEFFAHSFLHKSIRDTIKEDNDKSSAEMTTVAQKIARNEANFHAANASPTHHANMARSPIRAKFSAATPLAPQRDSTRYYSTTAPTTATNTGNQQQQQQHVAATGAVQRYGTGFPTSLAPQQRVESPFTRQSSGGPASPLRYTGAPPRIVSAGDRQAPLRPLSQVNSPSVVRRAIPPNIGNSSTNYGVARNHNTYNLLGEVASGATEQSPQKVISKQANQLNDSNDFTFLPPLSDKNSRYPTMNDGESPRQNQMQQPFSNTSSTVSCGSNNPVKQVQVHSSATMNHVDDRGDPVPSQRFAYAQMQERRKTLAGNLRTASSPIDEKSKTSTFERRIPSIEELNLPETKFLVHEPPLPVARSNLLSGTDSTIRPSLPTSATVSGIPKSATYTEMGKQILLNSPSVSRTAVYDGLGISPAINADSSSHKQQQQKSMQEPQKDDRFSKNNQHPASNKNDSKKNESGREAPRASAESNTVEDEYDEENGMEESTMSQVIDSITGDEELATLRRAQRSSSTTSQQEQQQHAVLRNSDEAAAAAADLLFFNNTVAGAQEPPPPELEAETVLDSEHRQTLAKLRFVLELIETLINVAEKKTNPMAMIMEGGTRKSSRQQSSSSASGSGSSEVSRRAEQLVLYVRSLHVLSSALVMAQRQINADTLKPSPAVQTVLNQLNEKYHHCLARSQELASLGIPGMDPSMCVVSAERIMYQHAIDLCQSAALDELFGHPQLCPKRYQTAYMMLHTLYEQVQNEQDKQVLSKYKTAVEKRMRILEQQGFVTTVKAKADDPVHYSRSHFHSGGIMPRNDFKNLFKESEHV